MKNTLIVERKNFAYRLAQLLAPLKPTVTKSSITVLCLFHNEKTPSLRINTDPNSEYFGQYYCWGCKAKGHFARFADAAKTRGIRLPQLRSELLNQFMLAPMDEPVFSDVSDVDGVAPLEKAVAWDKLPRQDWRGFSHDFLVSIGAQAWFDYNPLDDAHSVMIVFNVWVFGKLRGYVKCDLNDKLYLNAKGQWRNDYGLLFFDEALALSKSYNKPFLVLCEGVRDALILVAHGIPAVSLLGTQGLNKNRVDLIGRFGAAHQNHLDFFLYVAFDYDPDSQAGQKAAIEVGNVLTKNAFEWDFVAFGESDKKQDLFSLWEEKPNVFLALVNTLKAHSE